MESPVLQTLLLLIAVLVGAWGLFWLIDQLGGPGGPKQIAKWIIAGLAIIAVLFLFVQLLRASGLGV